MRPWLSVFGSEARRQRTVPPAGSRDDGRCRGRCGRPQQATSRVRRSIFHPARSGCRAAARRSRRRGAAPVVSYPARVRRRRPGGAARSLLRAGAGAVRRPPGCRRAAARAVAGASRGVTAAGGRASETGRNWGGITAAGRAHHGPGRPARHPYGADERGPLRHGCGTPSSPRPPRTRLPHPGRTWPRAHSPLMPHWKPRSPPAPRLRAPGYLCETQRRLCCASGSSARQG